MRQKSTSEWRKEAAGYAVAQLFEGGGRKLGKPDYLMSVLWIVRSTWDIKMQELQEEISGSITGRGLDSFDVAGIDVHGGATEHWNGNC